MRARTASCAFLAAALVAAPGCDRTARIEKDIAAFRSPTQAVREAACADLEEVGAAAVPALRKALGDPDARTREGAVISLAMVLRGPPRAPASRIDPILAGELSDLLSDSDPSVRFAAFGAFYTVASLPGSEAAVPVLRKHLSDPDLQFSCLSAGALGKMGRRALASRPDLEAMSRSGIERKWEAAHRAFMDILVGKDALELLGDPDPSRRRIGASFLWKVDSGSPEWLPAVLRALKDPDASVVAEAAGGVNFFPSNLPLPKDFLHAVLEALKTVPAPKAESIFELLAEHGTDSEEVAAAVIEKLKDKDPAVREKAAECLGHVGTPAAIPALRNCLQDPEESVREAARTALGRLGTVE